MSSDLVLHSGLLTGINDYVAQFLPQSVAKTLGLAVENEIVPQPVAQMTKVNKLEILQQAVAKFVGRTLPVYIAAYIYHNKG